MTKTLNDQRSEQETVRVHDEAVRRALNTPPKQNKELKKGNRKPSKASASEEKKP